MSLDSWVTTKAQKGLPSEIHGRGLFAVSPIRKNEIIVAKAGHIIDRAMLKANKAIVKDSEAQIAEEYFIAPLSEEEFMASMAYCNHSCEPNAGFGGNILVVAMRDIEPGEEITFDYAMMLYGGDDIFECKCGSSSCRKKVSGQDWEVRELQEKYSGYFQWFIQKRIEAQKSI